jgi:hypothetical protein
MVNSNLKGKMQKDVYKNVSRRRKAFSLMFKNLRQKLPCTMSLFYLSGNTVSIYI